MKAHEKKKTYRDALRKAVAMGRGWTAEGTQQPCEAGRDPMFRMMQAGYKVGTFARRQRRHI